MQWGQAGADVDAGAHDHAQAAVPWHRSLRTRIALWFGALAASLLALVLIAAYLSGRQQLIGDAVERMRFDAIRSADRFNAAARALRVTGQGIAGLALEPSIDRAAAVRMLQTMVDNDAAVIGGLLVLEPGVLPDGAPLAYHAGVPSAGVQDVDLVATGYDVFDKPWYRRTVAGRTPWWSEPYFNETAGGRWMTTLNLPLHDPYRGRNIGMVSLDVPMEYLAGLLAPTNEPAGVEAALYAPGGMIAVHPQPGVALRYDIAGYAAAFGRRELREVAQAHRARREYRGDAGDGGHLVLVPAEGGWSIQLRVSDAVVLEALGRHFRMLLGGGLLAMLVLALVVIRLSRRITDPLRTLTGVAQRFAAGEFDSPLPESARGDEVDVLAHALDRAGASIKAQMAEIETMAAARQKLDSELSIAREIQRAMLPVAPSSLQHGSRNLKAFAALEPAKAVGGDFFNFFQRDQTLWFAIGDVSDKGIPAALFMARSLSILETAIHRGGVTPADALREAAERLARNNEACMFATVLCGTIDVASGAMTVASAGHDAPLLRGADARVRPLPLESGPPLGFEVAAAYPQWQGRLEPGEALLAYTDGITEAFDAGDEAFGEDRLCEAAAGEGDAAALCRRVLAAVAAFARQAPQSDDITVLAISMDRLPVPQPA
ncbi:SpoIIE family protein phosphatase [Vulcaniibacterium tengchongense]|uniref:Sigma-B regulation protein RsbU (Phosphoserine phosphatase) n=1 Tax=Vulcaniibacterium tengchongense TaxID=1273429 RepID=A0A3N4VEL4_9GAMM|nr:SpoIIE family protein phosphatase [Vulcaniibacterium tengchongense]RPE81432.1 sigma-B regulation protein RsbU (phosphoserine phosphatase) [Vulcaniibacterium tengchongense]